jgi:hypothetical protein
MFSSFSKTQFIGNISKNNKYLQGIVSGGNNK